MATQFENGLTLSQLAERNAELVETLEKAQQHENEWKSLCEAAAVDLDDWSSIDDKSRELICKLADVVIAKAEQSAEWERKAISNFEDCAEMSAWIEELESQRKLVFTVSNRWADKFREAEKRIAELESKLANPVQLPKTNGYWTEQEKAYEEAITLAKRQIRLAGFRCEGAD